MCQGWDPGNSPRFFEASPGLGCRVADLKRPSLKNCERHSHDPRVGIFCCCISLNLEP